MDAARTNDLSAVLTQLESIDRRLARLEERSRASTELFEEMTPIGREVMRTLTERLGDLERTGYFAFGKELAVVADRVVTGFTPEDVRRLGDAAVGILETIRAMTQPHVLQIATEAADVVEKSDQAEPMGLFGVVRATRDDDVQKGMAVMMEVMRHVGRAAKAVSERRRKDPQTTQRDKLAAALGPRRRKPAGTEQAAEAPAVARAAKPHEAPVTPAPSASTVVLGIAVGPDGHLVDPKSWTDSVAPKLASALGIELDEPRWKVIRSARAEYDKTRASPNIRKLTQVCEVATKDLYVLFPKAPARTVAKIAGIPKPAGCI